MKNYIKEFIIGDKNPSNEQIIYVFNTYINRLKWLFRKNIKLS